MLAVIALIITSLNQTGQTCFARRWSGLCSVLQCSTTGAVNLPSHFHTCAAPKLNITSFAKAVWESVNNLCRARVHHIKSHDGNPYNEFVDSACTAISKGGLSRDVFPCPYHLHDKMESCKFISMYFLNSEAKEQYHPDLFCCTCK